MGSTVFESNISAAFSSRLRNPVRTSRPVRSAGLWSILSASVRRLPSSTTNLPLRFDFITNRRSIGLRPSSAMLSAKIASFMS